MTQNEIDLLVAKITQDIESKLIERGDERYVMRADCNEKQEKVNAKFANDDKRIDLILQEQKQMRAETKNGLKFNNWLTAAVLGAIVIAVVAFYFLAS